MNNYLTYQILAEKKKREWSRKTKISENTNLQMQQPVVKIKIRRDKMQSSSHQIDTTVSRATKNFKNLLARRQSSCLIRHIHR